MKKTILFLLGVFQTIFWVAVIFYFIPKIRSFEMKEPLDVISLNFLRVAVGVGIAGVIHSALYIVQTSVVQNMLDKEIYDEERKKLVKTMMLTNAFLYAMVLVVLTGSSVYPLQILGYIVLPILWIGYETYGIVMTVVAFAEKSWGKSKNKMLCGSKR